MIKSIFQRSEIAVGAKREDSDLTERLRKSASDGFHEDGIADTVVEWLEAWVCTEELLDVIRKLDLVVSDFPTHKIYSLCKVQVGIVPNLIRKSVRYNNFGTSAGENLETAGKLYTISHESDSMWNA